MRRSRAQAQIRTESRATNANDQGYKARLNH